MLQVFDSQLITGGGSGRKAVAPLAGFTWNVDDSGGAESMLWYDEAVGAGPRVSARRPGSGGSVQPRDVKATLALREWMAPKVKSAPAIKAPSRAIRIQR